MQDAAHAEANIIFGTVIDDSLGDEVRVTVIAAGFDSAGPSRKPVVSRRCGRHAAHRPRAGGQGHLAAVRAGRSGERAGAHQRRDGEHRWRRPGRRGHGRRRRRAAVHAALTAGSILGT